MNNAKGLIDAILIIVENDEKNEGICSSGLKLVKENINGVSLQDE